MKKYPKYKNSGVEWIGEIPEGWRFTKLKYYTKSKTGSTPDRINQNYWEKGTIPWMSSGEINQKFIKDISEKITQAGYENSSVTLLPINTVMIAMNGQGKTKGTAGILKIETTCNQSLTGFICDENNLHSFYLYYYLESKYYDLRGLVGEDRDGLTSILLKNLFINLPPITEQTQIANYLNHKTTQIDSLISKKEKLIELLKEERTAIINQAVTKGINPNVKLKNSNIEWLGEIPEHWEESKFGYQVIIKRGAGYQYIEPIENEINFEPIIRISDFSSFDPLKAKARIELDSYRIKNGDILIAGTGATAGICMLSTEQMNGMVHSYNVLRLIPKGVNSKFLFYCLDSHFINEQKNLAFTGSAQPFLDVQRISNLKILMPPINEQNLIVDFIESELLRINFINSNIQKEIELLKEYKTALISEVVTGKVDIRNEVIEKKHGKLELHT